jgi:integral membrane protein (TIGR01906 family)
VTRGFARILTTAVVAVATPIVVLGLGVAVFLNPIWVSFEQGRSGAPALTGYSRPELDRVTGTLLHDLVVGPPRFDVVDDSGRPVLGEREASHLRDVRGVFAGAAVVFAVALAVLAIAARSRSSTSDAVRRGLRVGARLLAAAVVVLGAVTLVAFDAAFQLFHEAFFAAGSFTFDPRSDRLVQLFPDRFWSETTIALGVVLLAAAIGVNRLAREPKSRRTTVDRATGTTTRRAERHATDPAGAGR